jgi:hypothetical protein
MKKLFHVLLAAAFGAALFLSLYNYFAKPAPVLAQGGFVSVGTYAQQAIINATVANANHVTPVTGTVSGSGGTLVAINNVGQSSHWLMFCLSNGGTVQVEVEGSGDSNTFAQISELGVLSATGCGILEAAGYYNYVRVNIIALNAGAGVFNAWYSATGNAIPAGGIVAGFKTSQPVTFVPSLNFSNTALKSTVATISTTPVAINEVSASNPNASAVFVIVNGTTPSTSMTYQVAANSSRDVPFPQGVQTIGASTVGCATAVGGAGDPATGCVVNIAYKPVASVASSVGSSGTVNAQGNTVPR